jgi:solute carrier family 45, member 1/2/4
MPTHDPAREGSGSGLDGDDEERFDAEMNVLMGSGFARSSLPDIHNSDIGGEWTGEDADGISSPEQPRTELSGKAGIILVCLSWYYSHSNTFLLTGLCLQGINNIFMVIPQFLITGVSAIIFAIFDPVQIHGAEHPSAPATTNGTTTIRIANTAAGAARAFVTREDALGYDSDGKSNSVVYIFRCVVSIMGLFTFTDVAISNRLGGIASLIAFVLAWRLAREMRHR